MGLIRNLFSGAAIFSFAVSSFSASYSSSSRSSLSSSSRSSYSSSSGRSLSSPSSSNSSRSNNSSGGSKSTPPSSAPTSPSGSSNPNNGNTSSTTSMTSRQKSQWDRFTKRAATGAAVAGGATLGAGVAANSEPTHVKANKDGGTTKTYRGVDGTTTKVVTDRGGNPIQSHVTNQDGTRVMTDLRTGTVVSTKADGTIVTQKPNGVIRERSLVNGSPVVKYTSPNGQSYSYQTTPQRFGNRDVHVYEPHYASSGSSMFSPNSWLLYWMLLNQSSSAGAVTNNYNGGASNGAPTNGAGASSSSEGASTKANDPGGAPVVSEFAYEWAQDFRNLPAGVATLRTYKDGISWMADYVVYEIIDQNTALREVGAPSALTKAYNSIFGNSEEEVNPVVAAYVMDSSVKGPLKNQIGQMIRWSRENKTFNLNDMMNDQSGEVKEGLVPVFILNELIHTNSDDDNTCDLEVGSAVKLINSSPNSDNKKVQVLQAEGTGDICEVGSIISMASDQLQELQNDLAARMDRAMSKIIEKQDEFQKYTGLLK